MAKTKLQLAAIEIHKRVVRILSEQLGVRETEVLLNCTSDDLGGDSLDNVEISMALEEEWETEFSDEVFENVSNVRDVIEMILTQTVCNAEKAKKAADELKDPKGTIKKKPDNEFKVVQHAPPPVRHIDDVTTYFTTQEPRLEFTNALKRIFADGESAAMFAQKPLGQSDVWSYTFSSRLDADGVKAVRGAVVDAGLTFTSVTETLQRRMGNMPGFEIVSRVHFSLPKYL